MDDAPFLIGAMVRPESQGELVCIPELQARLRQH